MHELLPPFTPSATRLLHELWGTWAGCKRSRENAVHLCFLRGSTHAVRCDVGRGSLAAQPSWPANRLHRCRERIVPCRCFSWTWVRPLTSATGAKCALLQGETRVCLNAYIQKSLKVHMLAICSTPECSHVVVDSRRTSSNMHLSFVETAGPSMFSSVGASLGCERCMQHMSLPCTSGRAC